MKSNRTASPGRRGSDLFVNQIDLNLDTWPRVPGDLRGSCRFLAALRKTNFITCLRHLDALWKYVTWTVFHNVSFLPK